MFRHESKSTNMSSSSEIPRLRVNPPLLSRLLRANKHVTAANLKSRLSTLLQSFEAPAAQYCILNEIQSILIRKGNEIIGMAFADVITPFVKP